MTIEQFVEIFKDFVKETELGNRELSVDYVSISNNFNDSPDMSRTLVIHGHISGEKFAVLSQTIEGLYTHLKRQFDEEIQPMLRLKEKAQKWDEYLVDCSNNAAGNGA